MRAYKYLLAFFSFIFLTVNVQAMMKRDSIQRVKDMSLYVFRDTLDREWKFGDLKGNYIFLEIWSMSRHAEGRERQLRGRPRGHAPAHDASGLRGREAVRRYARHPQCLQRGLHRPRRRRNLGKDGEAGLMPSSRATVLTCWKLDPYNSLNGPAVLLIGTSGILSIGTLATLPFLKTKSASANLCCSSLLRSSARRTASSRA